MFLAGERAFKLKRAVRYDYLDFTGALRRKALCEAEVRINRRSAPSLYHGVVAVTREPDGSLRLGGAGEPVEWVIEMTRFDQAALFDRLAARGELDLALMRPLATAIAALHRDAAHRRDHGGRSGMAWVVDGNAGDFAARGAGVLAEDICAAVQSESHRFLDRWGGLLDARRDGGYVRQCHGDLHLRNIVLWAGKPTLFDAVEFNDEIACIDVLYDLAFLLMDLWKRWLPRYANAVWNGYLLETGDLEGIALMPFFLSCRAAVRAKTSLVGAPLQHDAQRRAGLEVAAREYLRLALDLLRPPTPCLIAIGGLSGSGKSSVALALAPSLGGAPGAVVLRSDEVRKHLSGVSELERLGAEGYSAEASRRVYETLTERAALACAGGYTTIVDAVFLRPEDRAAIEEAAQRTSVPFVGLWLDAPEEVLVGRVKRRRGDASDADAAVVDLQAMQDVGPISWRTIDAAADLDAVIRQAASALPPR